MVGGSLRVLRLLPPLKTGRHDIAEILLKVALNTQNQSINHWLWRWNVGGLPHDNTYVVISSVSIFKACQLWSLLCIRVVLGQLWYQFILKKKIMNARRVSTFFKIVIFVPSSSHTSGRRVRDRMVASWICNYLCNRCLSLLMLWVRLPLRGRCTILCDLRKVGGFLRVLRFPPPIKLTATIKLKYCWEWR
jgi:hypothetical protein